MHRAARGEERAWTLLVGRFDATVRSLARRYGLNDADRDEVAQRTWLALFRHIERLTTHPALAGWLITTARNECLRVIAARKREVPVDEPIAGREPDERRIDDELLEAEQREALRRAVDGVPEHERKLMHLLLQEPPLSYDEISAALGIPKGSIGPTRGRCWLACAVTAIWRASSTGGRCPAMISPDAPQRRARRSWSARRRRARPQRTR